MALYDAFVSYSHTKDKPIAAALQSVVQKLGKPWYRRRALRVFRDDTSLSATPHLWPAIEQALSQSRFFILLASPEAAASKWVTKEVAYWLDHNSVETLLIGVTDGDLVWDETVGGFVAAEKTPLSQILSARFPNEPKWVDLRAYRDGVDKGDFADLGADFAAAIRGMPKEDLLSQEVRQHHDHTYSTRHQADRGVGETVKIRTWHFGNGARTQILFRSESISIIAQCLLNHCFKFRH